MTASAASGPRFWATVRLLLAAARRRSEARRRRNRELLGHKGGTDTQGWEGLAVLFAYVLAGVVHGVAAYALVGIVEVTHALPVEASGRMRISQRTLERVDAIERRAVETARHPTSASTRETNLRVAFDREEGRVEHARPRGDSGDLLYEHYRRHGREGFVVHDGSPGLLAAGRLQPLTALMGSLLAAGWFVAMALQGEGLEFDLQRRRHPMWEWLLSHPVDPRAVFLAEMLSPFWANPTFATAPVFTIGAFTVAYGFEVGLWAGLAAGVPLALAAACLSKSLEIVSFLRLPVRSRGAVLGILAWLGQATSLALLFAAFSPGVLVYAGRLLNGVAASLQPPLLGWALGAWGQPAAWKGVLACVAASAVMIAAAVAGSARATRRGLAGAFAGRADAPAPLARPDGSTFARDPLYRKELLWLWRDRGAIVQVFLIPLTLAVFQVFNFRYLLAEATRGWHLMAGASVLLGSYFLSILGPRSLASEGAALWIPLTWPCSLEDLLRAKARLWWLVSCVVVGPMLLVTAVRFPTQAWKVALVAVVWTVFARSLSERAVTLVTPTNASGEPEPVPRGRRLGASLGTLTFAVGVLSQQWALATAGVVYSWLTTAALWQNFRARLPYLFDQWSERLPIPPTVLHGMVTASVALEIMTLVTGASLALVGVERLWFVRSLSYGFVAIGTAVVLHRWLQGRGVSAWTLWRWDGPARSGRLALACVAGLAIGVALAFFARGYIELVRSLPESITGPVLTRWSTSSTEHAWLLLAVAVLAPIGEEFLFRGMLFRALAREWTLTQAVVGSACFFAVYHPPLSWLPVGLLGAASALLFRRSGHLVPSVLLHAAYNAVVVAAL